MKVSTALKNKSLKGYICDYNASNHWHKGMRMIVTFWPYGTIQLLHQEEIAWVLNEEMDLIHGTSYLMNILYFNPLVFPLTRLFLALQPRWLRSSQLCLSPELWAFLQHSYRCYIFSHFHGCKLSSFHHAATIHPLPLLTFLRWAFTLASCCSEIPAHSLNPKLPTITVSGDPAKGNQKGGFIPNGVGEQNHTAGIKKNALFPTWATRHCTGRMNRHK